VKRTAQFAQDLRPDVRKELHTHLGEDDGRKIEKSLYGNVERLQTNADRILQLNAGFRTALVWPLRFPAWIVTHPYGLVGLATPMCFLLTLLGLLAIEWLGKTGVTYSLWQLGAASVVLASSVLVFLAFLLSSLGWSAVAGRLNWVLVRAFTLLWLLLLALTLGGSLATLTLASPADFFASGVVTTPGRAAERGWVVPVPSTDVFLLTDTGTVVRASLGAMSSLETTRPSE